MLQRYSDSIRCDRKKLQRTSQTACGGGGLTVQQHFHTRALARPRLDGQQAAVAVDDVLDDREPEAGALLLAARLGIDAIEPLGQARHMLRCDALAVVSDGHGVVVADAAGSDADLDQPAVAAIFQRIVHEKLKHHKKNHTNTKDHNHHKHHKHKPDTNIAGLG